MRQIRSERVLYEKMEKEFQRQIENVSHDLRTPLTAIIGYLKIMDKKSLSREDKEIGQFGKNYQYLEELPVSGILKNMA